MIDALRIGCGNYAEAEDDGATCEVERARRDVAGQRADAGSAARQKAVGTAARTTVVVHGVIVRLGGALPST